MSSDIDPDGPDIPTSRTPLHWWLLIPITYHACWALNAYLIHWGTL